MTVPLPSEVRRRLTAMHDTPPCSWAGGLRWKIARSGNPTHCKPAEPYTLSGEAENRKERSQRAADFCRTHTMIYNRMFAIWHNTKRTQHAEARKESDTPKLDAAGAADCFDNSITGSTDGRCVSNIWTPRSGIPVASVQPCEQGDDSDHERTWDSDPSATAHTAVRLLTQDQEVTRLETGIAFMSRTPKAIVGSAASVKYIFLPSIGSSTLARVIRYLLHVSPSGCQEEDTGG